MKNLKIHQNLIKALTIQNTFTEYEIILSISYKSIL